MIELKRISSGGIPAALLKAERYRLLNESRDAESICRDILQAEPEHQEALIALVLAITDQFRTEGGLSRADEARELLDGVADEYRRAYYAGIVWERRGMAVLARNTIGAGEIAYDSLRRAMERYEFAERIRPPGNDEALLRWNTCARLINSRDDVRPAPAYEAPLQLE